MAAIPYLLLVTAVFSPFASFFKRWKRSKADTSSPGDVDAASEDTSLDLGHGGRGDSTVEPPTDEPSAKRPADDPAGPAFRPLGSKSAMPNGAEAVVEPPGEGINAAGAQGHGQDGHPVRAYEQGASEETPPIQKQVAGDEEPAAPLFGSSAPVPEPTGRQARDTPSAAEDAAETAAGDEPAGEIRDERVTQPNHRVSRLQVETVALPADPDDVAGAIDLGAAAGLRRIVGISGLNTSSPRSPAPIWPRQYREAHYWVIESDEVLGVAVFTEKSLDRGEDAEPTWVFRRDGGMSGLIAVYDGLGGAGSRLAVRDAQGQELKQAYVASRLVRAVSEQWEILGRTEGAAGLAERIDVALADAVEMLAFDETRTVSNLKRKLPTTIAAATVRKLDDWLDIEAIWAGDSRVFVLTAADGLQQITRDHARSHDILEQLINDSPMSNIVCADRPTSLSVHDVQISAPAVILATTDGVHGYVKTPGQVESLILSSLMEAESLDKWAGALIDEISTIAADDATLSLAAIGYGSFGQLQKSFAERSEAVAATQVVAFDGLSRDEHESFAAARRDVWESYRNRYESRLPPAEPARRRRLEGS